MVPLLPGQDRAQFGDPAVGDQEGAHVRGAGARPVRPVGGQGLAHGRVTGREQRGVVEQTAVQGRGHARPCPLAQVQA